MIENSEAQQIRSVKEDPYWSEGFRGKLVDVWFPSYKEYVRFTDYVFDEYQGIGLDFSNLPVSTAVRIAPWLLGDIKDQFAIEPVTDEVIRRGEEKIDKFSAQFGDDGTIFGSEEYLEAAFKEPEDDDGL